MATCPHCGDPGAPPRGWCLVCGRRVDAAPARPTGSVAASASPPPAPATAPAPAPLELDDPFEPEAPTRPAAVPIRTPAPVVMPAAPVIEPAEPVLVPEATDEIPPLAPLGAEPACESPHATLQLAARYEYSSVPGDDPPLVGVMVDLSAHGTPLREGMRGPVAHVILALDVSASMNTASKYPVLRDAIRAMLDDLSAPDSAPVLVSVVIFGRGAATVARAGLASALDPDALFRTIESHPLCFSRYTDVAGALDRAGWIAYEQTQRTRTMPVRIHLLTDGRPQDMARARAAADRIARVTCDMHALAFGADADVRALQELFAGRRGGTVKSVRRETLGDAFERIGRVAQQVVAVRCLVDVELAAGVVGAGAFRYRPARVRFPEPAFVRGRRFAADLGTIESGRSYTILLEVRPPETTARATELGTVRVRIPGRGGPIAATLRLTIPRTAVGSALGDEDAGVRMARDILDAIDDADPQAALRALRIRRDLYEKERRDPGLLALLDRAIALLEQDGSLAALTPGEHATLLAHTCTSGGDAARARTRRNA